jgi:hypothetical protein
MLGRPFGVPNDPAFQTRVLVAALDLFQRPAGPLLEDYPEDAPVGADDGDVQVCPVAFGREVEVTDLGAVFLREMQALLPWHDLARERRGRTVTGLTEQSVRDSAEMLAAFISGTTVQPASGLTLGETLKLACEDVRAFYYEAAAARPGNPDPRAIDDWFWQETAAGRVFLAFHALSVASPDNSVKRLSATSIVPRKILHEQPALKHGSRDSSR